MAVKLEEVKAKLRKMVFAAVLVCIVLAVMPVIAVPVLSQGNNNPNKLLGAQTYLLNILGKKADWNGDPSYESTDRRTMFVPEDVDAFLALHPEYPDVKIWVKQGSDFSVNDPNVFDDGQANLTMGPGKYEVYFVALGKPGKTAELQGWIYNVTANEYLMYVGKVTVTHNKKPNWQSGYDIFWVSPSEAAAIGVTIGQDMWIFDFLNLLETVYPGTEYLYLWKLVSGCKHIQVRFYKIG